MPGCFAPGTGWLDMIDSDSSTGWHSLPFEKKTMNIVVNGILTDTFPCEEVMLILLLSAFQNWVLYCRNLVIPIGLVKAHRMLQQKDNDILVLIRTSKNVSLCKSINKNDNQTVQKLKWNGNMCALWEFPEFDMIFYWVIL